MLKKMPTLKIITGELEENCYIAWLDGAREAVVFDPGWDAENISAELASRKLIVGAFLLTHCHGDHIGALADLKKEFPLAPIWVPEDEAEWLTRPTLNLSYFYGFPITAPRAEKIIRDGDTIEAAGLSFKAIHVPGHSPGGTAFYLERPDEKPALYCGDILFKSGIGRTDLPGGAGEDVLVAGIREKLFVLPGHTIVYPGHGETTTIGDEQRSNPFLN